MRLRDKYSQELLDYIKFWARDSYETGQPMDTDDIDEFHSILKEDNFNVSFEEARELFNYYFEQFDLYREQNDY